MSGSALAEAQRRAILPTPRMTVEAACGGEAAAVSEMCRLRIGDVDSKRMQ
jgi:hypothetical protein